MQLSISSKGSKTELAQISAWTQSRLFGCKLRVVSEDYSVTYATVFFSGLFY